MAAPTTHQIYNEVTERYSAASKGASADYGHAVAKAFGYSEQELADTPKEANLGLSCGNPLVMAGIREVGCSLPLRAFITEQVYASRN